MPLISLEQKIGEPDTVHMADAGSVSVRVSPTGLEWDHYVVELSLPGSNVAITYPFESSYGGYRLDVIRLTSSDTEEIVLVTGKGRGTSVRQEVVRILRVQDGKLDVLAETILSGFFDEGARWWYGISYVERAILPCADLVLRLHHDDPGDHPRWGGVHLIPVEIEKRISLCGT
jgi:hypothetical protein